jgi:transposase
MISIGVDISKETFETSEQEGTSYRNEEYNYDKKGMDQFINFLKKKEDKLLVTMEATGRYHLRLAEQLYAAGIPVSVVNPLAIKKYGEMKLLRVKSDKADAQLIAEYGAHEEPAMFRPVPQNRRKMMEILRGIDDFTLMRTQIRGRLEALKIMPEPCDAVIECFRKMFDQINESIKKLEKQLHELILETHKETYERAMSIPGIGKRIAALGVSLFGNFEDFENAGQAASYIGISPFRKQSGTSVLQKGHITKMGSSYARKLFYLGALNAARWNPHCINYYQRLLAKGKLPRVAHIAVAHKLLRQMFGVVKNKSMYDPKYVLKRKTA